MSSHKFVLITFLCIFILAPIVIDAHKILVIVPLYGKSHWNYMKVFIDSLLNRGHEITCITNISMGDNKPENYTEILMDPPYYRSNLMKQEDVFKWSSKSMFSMIMLSLDFIKDSCTHSFKNEQLQKFIHSKNQQFDLILIEDCGTDSFFAFGHKFKAPMAVISPYGVNEAFDADMGLVLPVSHVPSTVLPYTDNMDFFQRYYNSVFMSLLWVVGRFTHIPWHMEIVKKNFAHLEPLPSIDQLRKNVSIVFINAHRSIAYPRPSMPGMVYIGGAHIKPPKKLPNDLQAFLDEAEHGAIYFSLGSVVNASKLPTEKLDIFLDTFRQLKQRVIWKFESDAIKNVPENVLIRKWLPQTDILAHPNIVLFISQGGMFSNFEAVNYGVPILVIPFVSDQFRNALLVESKGYGKHIDFKDVTHESFYSLVKEMIADERYLNRAKEISAIFKDNVMHPMDEFHWWIDYIIKFGGAKHLKSHAVNLSLFTYLLLDVILVNVIVMMIFIFGTYYAIKKERSDRNIIDSKKKKH